MYSNEIDAIRAAFTATSVAVVGEGSFGVTFRVDAAAGTTALKLFRPNFDLGRSAREIDSLRRITSRNVVAFVDEGNIDIGGQQRPYFRTEFVDGQTLEARLRTAKLKKRDLLNLAKQVTQGLVALQVAGVVHRDLKPANILIEVGGRTVIVDLGLAKRRGAVRLTASNAFVGTALYAAPEQFGGAAHVDIRADIFSLGVILFEAAAGQGSHPFRCDQNMTEQEVYNALRTAKPQEHPIKVLRRIVGEMLQARPYRRINSPSILLDALRKIR
jgi:serine/threonine protein kinase